MTEPLSRSERAREIVRRMRTGEPLDLVAPDSSVAVRPPAPVVPPVASPATSAAAAPPSAVDLGGVAGTLSDAIRHMSPDDVCIDLTQTTTPAGVETKLKFRAYRRDKSLQVSPGVEDGIDSLVKSMRRWK